MNIETILARKSQGIDCTEEESGFMKMFLKEIMELFPCEFSEAIEEQNNHDTRIKLVNDQGL